METPIIEPDPKDRIVTLTDQAPWYKRIGAGVLVLVFLIVAAVSGLIFWLTQNPSKTTTTNQDSSESIRQVFTPTPAPSGVFAGLPSPTPTQVLPTSTPTPSQTPTPTPTPTPTLYENSTLAFSMELPNDWQYTVGNDGHTIIFTRASGETVSVQQYNVTNETLDTIKQQLSGSSSVNNIKQTTFLNEPALSFRVISNNQSGLAVIHNNKIYYIIAPSLTTPPVSSFEFK